MDAAEIVVANRVKLDGRLGTCGLPRPRWPARETPADTTFCPLTTSSSRGFESPGGLRWTWGRPRSEVCFGFDNFESQPGFRRDL